jgi:hypothetical protein
LFWFGCFVSFRFVLVWDFGVGLGFWFGLRTADEARAAGGRASNYQVERALLWVQNETCALNN